MYRVQLPSVHTHQNGSHHYGPVLWGCTVIADLLIWERHKPFILIPIASLERTDIWPGCLFFTQKVCHEIHVLLWNKLFFFFFFFSRLSFTRIDVSLCLAILIRAPTLTYKNVLFLHPGGSQLHLTFTDIL